MWHRGRAIGLFDLRPEQRPQIIRVTVFGGTVLDVVGETSISALGLPACYPFEVAHKECWPIARAAYEHADILGVAYRSNAESTATTWIGEELAWFDRAPAVSKKGKAQTFDQWYPDIQP
jgi:hypothetical protein